MHAARAIRIRFTVPVAIAAAVCVSAVSCGRESEPPDADSDPDFVARARQIHEDVITIDTHDDISSDFATAESDPGERDGRRVTLPKMREGGLDVAFFVVYVGQTERTPENYAEAQAEAVRKFEAIHRLTDQMYPDEIGFAW
ncbi:MAG: membrane dipeptidase, partial [Gemmatimonadota bacterium]